MALVEQLPADAYLKGRHVRFELVPHTGTFTAKSEARAMGLPDDCVLKVVILRLDEGYAMAIVPASRRVDLSLVTRLIPEQDVCLATEGEIAASFPGFDLGTLPPLPGLLGIRAYVDPAILDLDEVAFADGSQTESIIASPRELFWGEDVIVAPISRMPEVWGPWGFEGDAISF